MAGDTGVPSSMVPVLGMPGCLGPDIRVNMKIITTRRTITTAAVHHRR